MESLAESKQTAVSSDSSPVVQVGSADGLPVEASGPDNRNDGLRFLGMVTRVGTRVRWAEIRSQVSGGVCRCPLDIPVGVR